MRNRSNPSALRSSSRTLVVVVIFSFCLLIIAGAQTRRERTISMDPQSSIEQRLLPDDDVVLVNRDWLDVIMPARPLNAEEWLNSQVHSSDVVAVATIEHTKSGFIPGGSWIETELRGTYTEVLRDTMNHVSAGKLLEAHISGGEASIGRVRIIASDNAPATTPRVVDGRSYLLFLRDSSLGLYLINPLISINGDRLSYLWSFNMLNIPARILEGKTLGEARSMIAHAEASPRLEYPTKFVLMPETFVGDLH